MNDYYALLTLFSVIISAIWMYIGFRAMKAHERIAHSSDEIRHALRVIARQKLESTNDNVDTPDSP